jgi:Family of unknown function (DUF6011)
MAIETVSRSCTRCQKDLTDAASQEAGIGPICRNLDNAVLARQIPSNLPEAIQAYKTVNLGGLTPQAVPTFIKVEAALLAPDAVTRADWRETVKQVEWVLSWHTAHLERQKLTSLVYALGYIGLAALWNGEAATGKATVVFKDNRLFVFGPKNRAARMALKAIAGKKFHPSTKQGGTEERAGWSVPASEAAKFTLAVQTHYPNNEGLKEALEAAKNAKPEPKVGPAAVAATATVTKVGTLLKIKTPWNPDFVNAIRALPKKARNWNPLEKVWEVQVAIEAPAMNAVKTYFPDAVVVGA